MDLKKAEARLYNHGLTDVYDEDAATEEEPTRQETPVTHDPATKEEKHNRQQQWSKRAH